MANTKYWVKILLEENLSEVLPSPNLNPPTGNNHDPRFHFLLDFGYYLIMS